MLSRRTSTRRRLPSTAAASMTARRGIRPRLVLAPMRLFANRRTSQAARSIRASTATNAKIKVTCMFSPRQMALSSSLASPDAALQKANEA